MAKRTKKYSFKKGQVADVDTFEMITRELEITDHFEKIPDKNCSDYGNRNWEQLSDIEKCTKSFKITIIIED